MQRILELLHNLTSIIAKNSLLFFLFSGNLALPYCADCMVGKGALHRARLLARAIVRPTGPAFGRPDDKLCPRGQAALSDRMDKDA